jgi:hypothetical protein
MTTTGDFSLARTKHMAWKTKLRNFLNGKGDALSEDQATSPRHCDLGIWLYGQGLSDYASVFEMKKLEIVHARLHATIGAVIKAKKAGNIDAAKREYEKVGPISEEIVGLLNTIEAKVKKAA